VNAISSTAAPTLAAQGAAPGSMDALTSSDFMKLLVTQLTNQDPMQPMGNEELLRQISSIRDIQLSTNMSDALTHLTGQQNFSSASGLIGQHVTTMPDASGASMSGVVVGIRFDQAGNATLVLSDGSQTPLKDVATIESPLQAGQGLMGQNVVGLDRRDSSNPQAVQGVVTGVQTDDQGQVVLELDTGDSLRLRDVIGVTQDASA